MSKIIAKNGKSEYVIVIPNNAHIVEKTGAEELFEYLKKALGAELKTVEEKDVCGKGIYIGRTEFAEKCGILGKSKENWIMKMAGDNLVLTGGKDTGDRGIIYSVYHFIEDVLGVRWWSAFEEDVPELSELALPDDFEREGTPAYTYRKPYLQKVGYDGFAYLARHRVNAISAIDDSIPEGRLSDAVRKYGDVLEAGRPHHAHTLGKLFPVDKYFEEHPDWWSWNREKGERLSRGQYCLTNEGFIKAVEDKFLEFIEEDLKLSEELGVELPCSYSLDPNDVKGYSYCECEKCQAIRDKSGLSGYIVWFANRVVRDINKKYPFVKVLISPYLETLPVPKDDTVPDKNVVIRIAHIYEDISRGVNAPTNKFYRDTLKGWAERCKKTGAELRTYEYLYNIITNYPLPSFFGLKDKIKGAYDIGVTGMFWETQNYFADSWEINKYLVTHLMEDPNLDDVAMIDDLAMRYYGPAGECVKEYFNLLKEGMDKTMLKAFCCLEHSPFNYVDSKIAIEGERILEKAFAKTDGVMPYAGRVMWLRKPLDATIIFKYFDLKEMAERQGERFFFDREVLRERIIAALEWNKTRPGFEIYHGGFDYEIDYFKNLKFDAERKQNIPEEFKDVPKEDIYQFEMKNMIMFVSPGVARAYGQSVVADDGALSDEVLKLSYDEGTDVCWNYERCATSFFAEEKRPLQFVLQREDEVTETLDLYKEDMKAGYNVYKVGSLSGIRGCPNVRAALFSHDNFSINIGGLAVTFPMESCDVYFRVKFSGEVYGGDVKDENAMFFDRMIVIRK